MPSSNALIGFGVNYNHNFGAAQKISLKHSEEESVDSFSVEDTPWEKDKDELVDITTTASSSVFLTKSGKVYSCGTIHGKVASTLRQTVIQLPLKCVEIAAGRHFCLARMEGGLAVCSWGAGHFGQLALGGESAPFMDHPTVIESLLPHVVGAPVTSISAGYWHAMAVTQSGSIYSWGCNRNAQCGFKPQKDPPTLCNPQPVRFDSISPTPKIVKTVGGRSHSVALDEKGKVYCWGGCQYGQCGILVRRRGGVTSPTQVEALNEVKIVDIAAGDSHTLAMTGGGRVFAFGCGFEGQLGAPAIVQMNPKPKLVMDLDFMAIQAGRELKEQQSGNEIDEKIESSPKHINDAGTMSKDPKIVAIYAAGNCSMARSSIGQVYVWGCNDVQNLGIPKPKGHIPFAEPGYSEEVDNTSLRPFNTQSFDSSHNIGLPQRVECLMDTDVSIVAASPTFMWCAGSKRPLATTSQTLGPKSMNVSLGESTSKDGNDLSVKRPQSMSKIEQNGPPIDPPEIKDGTWVTKKGSDGTSTSVRTNSSHSKSKGKHNLFPPKSPSQFKTKRRFSLPKAIGKLVRRASAPNSIRSDTEDKDVEGRNDKRKT